MQSDTHKKPRKTSRRLRCIAVVLLFHILLVLLLPPMERTMYRYSIQHADRWFQYCAADNVAPFQHLGSWFGVVAGFPLLVHISPSWHLQRWHEGLLPAYFAFVAQPERLALSIRMQSKLFWAELLKQEHVPTPVQLALIEDGEIRNSGSELDTMAIVKPAQGWMGSGIQRSSAAEFAKLKRPGQWIVQEAIVTAGGTIETFRVVTMVNGSDAVMVASLRVREENGRSITSNRGNVQPVELTGPQVEVVSSLRRVHRERFPLIPLISWDLMDGLNGTVVLEGNAPGAVCWKTDCDQILTKADQLYRSFYADHCW